ncbi:cell wall-binding protein [Lacrimispora sp.]|uniref:cell wall-binding protein n=1 Tax=Lacrimispora sp. TaxID=2719234 RepID=UPI0028A66F0C|nr:cell wall-binding protein [Lacrimispora sp.]
MRKQTKLVAVLSTAALLALGASMSSFAATGWQEENGTWVYYDKSGDKVTEKWAKSGDNWFFLNDDGEMATDIIVEDNDNYYYVDENGSMVTNKWVSVENSDYDGDDDEDPLNHWYYFGANGKAYKSSTTSNSASFKTINSKKYLFDDEGKMLYGWVDSENGERITGDDKWKDGDYYLGDENDGAQRMGQWESMDIVDSEYTEVGAGLSSNNTFDDENQTRWFYFKTNGKKMTDEKGKTINGKKYSFDEYGRMNAEWVNFAATPTTTTTPATATTSQGNKDYTHEFRYYGSPEDGARVTKGWFQVVPDSYLNEGDYDDDSTNWYYSDKDGKLVASEIKTINGKKYAFDNFGAMQDGLKAVKFEGNSTTKIAEIQGNDDISGSYFDTEDAFKQNVSGLYNTKEYRLYYFGNGDDGAMKTGKQTIDIDGESFNFLFNKSGSTKGQGKFGVDSDKYYLGGMLLKADKDDKYSVVKTVTDKTTGKFTEITLLTTEQFLDDEYINAESSLEGVKNANDYQEYYDVTTAIKDAKVKGVDFKVVNTSGSVQKKAKAKDGDDRYYKLSGENIEAVYVED